MGKRDNDDGDSGEQTAAEGMALAVFEAQANERIRKARFDGQWWFSIVDVVGVLTDSASPRKYWVAMKARIQGEGFRGLSAKSRQLKMRSLADGKFYTTDAADRETLLRIIQSIPSPKAEPFKQWLAQIGAERMEEVEAAGSSAAMDRLRAQYRKKGYSDKWIELRIEKILVRNKLTDEWSARGVSESRKVAVLTDDLNVRTFDVTAAQHREVKHLTPNQNLQDSEVGIELALSNLADETSTLLHQTRDSQGFGELLRDTHEAGDVAGAARRDIEARTNQPVVSPINYKQLRQERQRQLQAPLFDEDAEEQE